MNHSDANSGTGEAGPGKRRVRVVAALIREPGSGRVLITQRQPKAFMPLKWEFPGGKVEAGESDKQALTREIEEELGVRVAVGEEFLGLIHEYPAFVIDFHVYNCKLESGDLRRKGVHDFRWVELDEIESFEFPPADEPTVRKLVGK